MQYFGGINKDNSKTNSSENSDFGDNNNSNSQKDYNIKANDFIFDNKYEIYYIIQYKNI